MARRAKGKPMFNLSEEELKKAAREMTKASERIRARMIKEALFVHIVALLVWVIAWLLAKLFVPCDWHLVIGAVSGGLYGVFVNEIND